MSWVALAAITVTRTPATVTVSSDATVEKFVPVIVAVTPGVSVPGVMSVIVGEGRIVIVTGAVPTLPSLVALMVTVPGALPVTMPDALTVAFESSDDVHTTVRPLI